jgi:DNA-binding CsgD family transcriptional regulator
MFEHLLENLLVGSSEIQTRSDGAAFLKVAREAYPLKSLVYVAVNIPIAERKDSLIHCTYADDWAKHSLSRERVNSTDSRISDIFAREADLETLRWPCIHTEGEIEPSFGASFPLPRLRGENAAFIMIADRNSLIWPAMKDTAARDLRVLGNYFHQHMLRIFGHDVSKEMLITAREIDCLRWMAAGKTAWEVSVILGISERTVRFHLNAAREKLNCATTTQAVAKAVSQQLFIP